MQSIEFTKPCPKCEVILTYKSKTSFARAIKRNTVCLKCKGDKLSLSQHIIEQILKLNSERKLNREIARELNINHRTVAEYLSKHGRTSDFANQPIDMVSDTEACCRKCNVIKSVNEFQFGRKGQKYEYKFSFCNECRKKQIYLNLNNNVERFLADRYNRMVRRSKSKSIPCTITKEEFIQQYHNQKGLCFYTDEVMVCEVGADLNRNALSVDKIIPEQGYIKENFVFTTHRINTCKCDLSLSEIEKWMPDWYHRIKIFLKETGLL